MRNSAMKIFGRASDDNQFLKSSFDGQGSIGSSSSYNEVSNGTDHGCSSRRWVSGLSALVAAVTLSVMAMRMEGRIPMSRTQMSTIATLEQENNETETVSATMNDVLQMTSTSCGREHSSSPFLHQPLLLQRQRQLQSICEDNSYMSETLKLVYELPFASLFDDAKGQRRFDASSVVLVGDHAYTVYDKSYAIGKVSVPHFEPFSTANSQIGLATRGGEDSVDDSRFEAIIHNGETGNFFAVQESVEDQNDGTFHAMFVELSMNTNETDYQVVETCPSEFRFNKSLGISGAVSSRDIDNTFIVLALCSVNHCDNGDKDDKGNGRIIVMTHMPTTTAADGSSSSCQWKTVRILNIPASANFSDYSDLAITANGRVAITSRKESEVWIGQLLGQDQSSGRWQVLDMAFDEDVGDVYNFPRGNNECGKVYCSVDGVEWLNDDMLLMISDKMGDTEDFWCFEKDQSIHIFAFPEHGEGQTAHGPTAGPPAGPIADRTLFPSSTRPAGVSSPSGDVHKQSLSGLCFFCIVLFYAMSMY